MIGARVREAREAVGMSQTELGVPINVSPMAISKKERGIDGFSAPQLHRIARTLKRPADWFLRDIK